MVYADNSTPIDYASDSIYTCSATYDGQPEHYRRIARNILGCGVPVRVSVLDVGCALGGLIQTLQECTFRDVRGISLSQGEVDACLAKGLKAEVRDVFQADPADLVTVSHVLEHVQEVQPFLQRLRAIAREFIYIEVPDALKYVQYFSSLCQGFNAEHINHFDLSHLMLACLKAGMEIYESGSYDVATRGGGRYPVIWILAKPNPTTLKERISAYATRLEEQFRPIREKLKRLPPEIAVWGAGQTTQMLLGCGLLRRIRYATDTNPVFHEKRMGKCEIVPPEQFKPPPEIPILVSSQLSKDTILARIKELGLANQVILLEDK